MREAKQGDKAIIIGAFHDAKLVVGLTCEVLSDPQEDRIIQCPCGMNAHNYRKVNHVRAVINGQTREGVIPTRWLIPVPPENKLVTKVYEMEKEDQR